MKKIPVLKFRKSGFGVKHYLHKGDPHRKASFTVHGHPSPLYKEPNHSFNASREMPNQSFFFFLLLRSLCSRRI